MVSKNPPGVADYLSKNVMKRLDRNDVTMLIGVVIALLVMFQQPIQYSIQLGRELEQRYGLTFVPGFAVLCVVFAGHYFVSQLNNAAKRRRSDQTARVAAMGRSLAHATSLNTLRNRLRQYLVEAMGSDGVWVVIRIDERWVALTGGLLSKPHEAADELTARADRVRELDASDLDAGHGIEVDGHICFHLPVGAHGFGVLGAPLPPEDATELKHNLASVSPVIAIAAHNVQLLKEIDEHGVLDGLTGCFNRTQGMKVLDAELQRGKRPEADVTLLMLDLDYFKSVNDEYGHLCANALLTAVGKRMHEQLRNSDVKIRYGEEEFVVLLPDTPITGATHVAEILNRELGKLTLAWEGHEVSTTVSIGVAVARAGELDRRTLIGRADAALYRAKREGRDRVCVDPRSLDDHPSLTATVTGEMTQEVAAVATGPVPSASGRKHRP